MAKRSKEDLAAIERQAGWKLVAAHPLFAPLAGSSYTGHHPDSSVTGFATLSPQGSILVNPTLRADPEVWARVFAHLLLHLGFGHTATSEVHDSAHQAASCVSVERFLGPLGVGRRPEALPDLPQGDERTLASRWRTGSVPPEYLSLSVAGPAPDFRPIPTRGWMTSYTSLLARGLSSAVAAAVEVAGGKRASLTTPGGVRRPWELALSWFVASYPLLGAVAASLKLVDDPELVDRLGIAIAAVNPSVGEVYVNPRLNYSDAEWRFVLAHEMLHAALKHDQRSMGRDPVLFNIAADFVVDGWLVEMGVGTMPEGLLYDPQFQGFSVEEVYDRISVDQRRFRKLAALAGKGKTEWVHERFGHPTDGAHVDLDELYRRALNQGLEFHDPRRGTLPAGLVEEIRALEAPAPTWDVQLARWFEMHVPAVDVVRSYARPSRRQSSTPDIPRPGKVRPERFERLPTFGVVLDTSGSMDPRLLGIALGSVSSFALARGVPAVRVVFCDAVAYDAGFISAEDIANKVKVRGRGGTRLQPGIDLIEAAKDFPADGPILVITDGWCEPLVLKRPHAFLIPARNTLPFTPKGPIFRMT